MPLHHDVYLYGEACPGIANETLFVFYPNLQVITDAIRVRVHGEAHVQSVSVLASSF
jgi:hypothetical protein